MIFVSAFVHNNMNIFIITTVLLALNLSLTSVLPRLVRDIYCSHKHACCTAILINSEPSYISVIESGDDLSSLHDKHVLLLVNHQSTADIPCVMSALLPKSQVIGQIMWFMDYIFKFTNFGVPSCLHGDFFIQQVSTS